jgi:hypothetical protein
MKQQFFATVNAVTENEATVYYNCKCCLQLIIENEATVVNAVYNLLLKMKQQFITM